MRASLTILLLMSLTSLVGAEPSLTIYNQHFAVVRSTVPLDLKKGINEVSFSGATAWLEPRSVILRDPAGRQRLRIIEQNYRGGVLTERRMLRMNEGKTIQFLDTIGGQRQRVEGRIVRAGSESQGYAPIIEVADKVLFKLPGKPLFPKLDEDALLRPLLHWLIGTDQAGKLDAELYYISGGLSWEADYNVIAPEESDEIELVGWITMSNTSGRTFTDATIKLMAGDVSKKEKEEYRPQFDLNSALVDGDGVEPEPVVTEKRFDEYHLYTVSRPTTLLDRETKQVEFCRASGVESTRLYVYDGVVIDEDRYDFWGDDDLRERSSYGTGSQSKVRIIREFKNSDNNHLGIPLPKGRVRVYGRDDDGQLYFVGENDIGHTPRDETVRIETGNAFDLVGERVRSHFQVNREAKFVRESFAIKLRNHKDKAVEIRVVEHLYRWTNWQIKDNSDDFEKTDSRTIQMTVQVEPNEEKVITYTAHYTW